MSSGRSGNFDRRRFLSLDPAVDLDHRRVVGVVVRIVRDEPSPGQPEILHLRDRPQLSVAEATRAALALDLNGTKDLVSLGRGAVTIGMHRAVVPLVVELEDGPGPDGLTDPGFPAHRSPDRQAYRAPGPQGKDLPSRAGRTTPRAFCPRSGRIGAGIFESCSLNSLITKAFLA